MTSPVAPCTEAVPRDSAGHKVSATLSHGHCCGGTIETAHGPTDEKSHRHASLHPGGSWREAAAMSLHCVTGCSIGEWTGLSIGLLLGLPTTGRVSVAVVLSYLSGFALTLTPLLRRGTRFPEALKLVWVGEAVSIGTMEIAMNIVDFQMGGMRRGMTLLEPRYWVAFSIAAAAGFLAAVPVNYWMLRRGTKHACH